MELFIGLQVIFKVIFEILVVDFMLVVIIVYFKVFVQGIILIDNQRKFFFRCYYFFNIVIFCDLDLQERKWMKIEGGVFVKFFGFVVWKQGSIMDNVCYFFVEFDFNQLVFVIVNFVFKVMLNVG